ncbi:PREDICTED: glomulin isoform X1 [Hipposideros armiger]|uniref:Glomulin isoform X1 n=1 Tax=Hipposideros armiger TaxID=186990 RepID=A0A8B7Q132_HIPAR|nr:PREDICTED: glomulin isoform X1 [Hipposideros armiger]XP_019482524.1 PREDICTED: glomulin isoform X1 [Hipposideros armiger]XP_019482525.1 PREDICTED: glomulin isoform X1 [Hipposideros armiger]XP_019482526.1 PREDICTED: glomulin isoform X1 [Hipposideros armiger]XP_019482527.1 PREDICTED: glomulin isoform X1 [Hipposideros armiger]
MAVEELQSVINRCQILEEQDFKEEDFGLFQVAGQRCIDEGHIDQLLEIIQNEKNKVIIKHMGWNLVGPVVRCLLWNNKEDDKRKYFLMLDLLIKLCNPKELLLGLLELIEEPSGKQISQIILLLLQPLQTVIQKLHSNKAYSVGLALSTVWSQLCLLPVPYSEEQIQTDNYGLCQCCMALIEFTKPFVEEVIGDKENSLENEKLKDELLKFCFKSLKCPLLTAQFLEQSEEAGNDPLRCFASEIIEPLRPQISTLFPQPLMLLTSIPLAHSRQTVGILSAIGHPFPKMIFNHGRKKRTWDYLEFEEEEDKQLADSMASLAYLVFVQGISIDQLPMVLSPSYLLQFNMGHIEVFLQRTEESVFCKGLDLLENGLLRIEDNSLLYHFLEIKSFLTVPQGLVKVMTLCPVETLRKKSLAMLQLYINKLDSQGKYTLFRCLLNTSNHSGVEAFIIQNIKNQIDISLKRTYNKWFTGPQLISLLDLVLFLPEGAETDLLQNSDRIMASLNLLRYLVIKDNENDNQTGIWTELGKIENNFLKPLHTGLNMSKAHYEAQIKNNQENSQEVQKSKDICSITVGGEDLPNMPPEMQLKVLHSALFTFDLIESVLARVEELIEIKRSTSEENTGIK